MNSNQVQDQFSNIMWNIKSTINEHYINDIVCAFNTIILSTVEAMKVMKKRTSTNTTGHIVKASWYDKECNEQRTIYN